MKALYYTLVSYITYTITAFIQYRTDVRDAYAYNEAIDLLNDAAEDIYGRGVDMYAIYQVTGEIELKEFNNEAYDAWVLLSSATEYLCDPKAYKVRKDRELLATLPVGDQDPLYERREETYSF